MSCICLGLLCGLPASGKSTLAGHIQDHAAEAQSPQYCVLLLQYDELIPASLEQQLVTQTDEQGGSMWKSLRTQITTCVDHLLDVLKHGQAALADLTNWCENDDDFPSPNLPESQPDYLAGPPSVDPALWGRFVLMLRKSIKKTMLCESRHGGDLPWLVLIDDNMQYSGMRYQYCQLARKHEVGLCTIHVVCPVEEALQRNWSRAERRVKESVITVMNDRLEPPDPNKRPWEKYSASVDGTSSFDLQPLVELFHEALLDPQRPSPEEDTEGRVMSRYICSTNAIHQADQILRRCLSVHMAEAKEAGMGRDRLKSMSAELTKIRSTILSDLRQGTVTLTFQLDEKDIPNASKSSDNPFFQFVQALFSARTKCSS